MAHRGCTKGVILMVKATYLSGSTFGVLLRGSHTDEIGTSTVLYFPGVIGVRTFVRTRVVPLEGNPLRAIHTLDLSTVDDTVLRALSEYFLTEMMKPLPVSNISSMEPQRRAKRLLWRTNYCQQQHQPNRTSS